MFYVVQPQEIKLCYMVIVERVIDLSPVLAAADEPHVAQPAQLMRHSRLAHFELSRNISNVHLALEQNRDDPQAGRVAEGAEQVSQVGRDLILE